MGKYQFDDRTKTILEKSCIPYAIFQMVESRIIPLVVSDGFCDIFQIRREDAMDQLEHHIFDNDHPDDVARIGNAVLAFAKEGGDYDILHRSKSGNAYRIFHACGRHVYTQDGARLAVLWYMDEGPYSDEKKALFDQVMESMLDPSKGAQAKNYDLMTGLPATNYFFKLAEDSCVDMRKAGKKPAILHFDFNNMKGYNQKFGFAQGDRLILGLRDILVRFYSNVNCCRFGADHFVVLTSEDGLEKKLEQVFAECEKLEDGESLTLRVGICLSVPETGSIGPAIDQAKMAGDQNRESTVSVYSFYTEELAKKARMRSYVLENLDKALREGWIQVYYQPIIRSANGSVCDEEALARWIDPILGFLSPADFIPALEDAGVVYKLDLFVVEQVLRKMQSMGSDGFFVVPTSVNISRADFRSCDIVKEIKDRVDAAHIGRDMLTIEITESAVGADLEYIRERAEDFNKLGFHVWMDDYGSGYSSPDILPTISFDTVKLDMQFMRQFDRGKKSRIIISELIKMAMNLGMETVVEGVETAEQVEFLKEVGATKMQGFYFCKPLPLKEIYHRYETGTQIGFENPKESDYYSVIGRVNLYDITPSLNEHAGSGEYFNTQPAAIFEVGESDVAIIRCNQTYQKLLMDLFQMSNAFVRTRLDIYGNGYGSFFMKTLERCAKYGGQLIIDENTADRKKLKILMRKLSENPVNHVSAVAVIMLEIMEDHDSVKALTYTGVARALSDDYLFLFHVDLEKDYFEEYRPDPEYGDLRIERTGDDFFAACRRDAGTLVHKEDRAAFIAAFTKEKILMEIQRTGSFRLNYRLLRNGEALRVLLKAVKTMEGDEEKLVCSCRVREEL